MSTVCFQDEALESLDSSLRCQEYLLSKEEFESVVHLKQLKDRLEWQLTELNNEWSQFRKSSQDERKELLKDLYR